MKRSILIAVLITAALVLVALNSASGPAAPPSPYVAASAADLTPQQTITKLRAQLRTARLDNADKQDEIDAQDDLIANQTSTIARLRARDPLDAITARTPDGLWDAMRVIYAAFPSLPPGDFCGYDKSNVPGDGIGLVATSYTFYRWSGC